MSLYKAILQSELQVLTSFCSLSLPPRGLALMFVWTSTNFNYVRFLDTGVLCAFSETMMRTWQTKKRTVPDRIATSTDLHRLSTLQRSRRDVLLQKAFDSISAIPKAPKLSIVLATVGDDIDTIRHTVYGELFTAASVVESARVLISNPQVEADHMDELITSLDMSVAQHTLTKQLHMLNLIPAQRFMDSCTSMSVAESRFAYSAKSLILRDPTKESEILEAMESTTRKRTRAKTSSDETTPNIIARAHAVRAETAGKVLTLPFQTSLSTSLLDKFKLQLRQQGLIRVRAQGDRRVEIVWNKFNPVKGMYPLMEPTVYDRIYLRSTCIDLFSQAHCVTTWPAQSCSCTTTRNLVRLFALDAQGFQTALFYWATVFPQMFLNQCSKGGVSTHSAWLMFSSSTLKATKHQSSEHLTSLCMTAVLSSIQSFPFALPPHHVPSTLYSLSRSNHLRAMCAPILCA